MSGKLEIKKEVTKMITVPGKDSCDLCIHILPNKDGWIPCCKAYPDGLPKDYLYERVEVAKLKECAPGFHFEPNVELQKECGYID